MTTPMAFTWMGERLSDVPRAELEEALIDAHHQIIQLEKDLAASRVAHIHDIALAGRERLRQSSWFLRLFTDGRAT